MVQHWRPVGSVLSLHTRAPKEPAPRRVQSFDAVAHHGLVGDRHALPHSPRQLLVAGATAYERFGLPSAALRENLLVDFSTQALQSGELLRVGRDVILWLTFACEPCGKLERRCPGTSKSLGTERGMLARVLRGGTAREGDPVFLAPSRIPAIAHPWRERVLNVVRTIPPGHVLRYAQLAEMAGVAKAYCRVFPKVLAGLPAELAGRVVRDGASRAGLPWDGAELFDVAEYLVAQ